MTAFRDAIARALSAADPLMFPGTNTARPDADAVLAMPELQAIRQIIYSTYEPKNWTSYANKAQLHRSRMALDKVPESVIDWVLA